MLIVFKKCHFNYCIVISSTAIIALWSGNLVKLVEYIMSTNLLQNEDMGFGLRYNILVKQLQYLTSVL